MFGCGAACGPAAVHSVSRPAFGARRCTSRSLAVAHHGAREWGRKGSKAGDQGKDAHMSTDGSMRTALHERGALAGTYLSWYIACFQSGDS